MTTVQRSASFHEFEERVRWIWHRTLTDAETIWSGYGYDAFDSVTDPKGGRGTPDGSWYIVSATFDGDPCGAVPEGGHPLTVHVVPAAIPYHDGFGDFPHHLDNIAGGSSMSVIDCACTRLYLSNHNAGDGNTAASLAAPNLGTGDLAANWDDWGTFDFNMLYATPAGSDSGSGTGPNWTAVNAPVQHVAIAGGMIRLDTVSGLLEKVQAGGTISAQFLANARHGVGISEASQNHLSAIDLRVYRPGTGFVGTGLDVTTVGDLKWPAQATMVNRSWHAASFTGIPSAVGSDYLCVTLGAEHLGPTSGGTGCGFDLIDDEASDLPEDQTSTTYSNAWIEVCG